MARRWMWYWIIPATVLLVLLLTIGANVFLYIKIPKGFFPQQDTGRLGGAIVGEQHISYQSLVEKAKWFEEQVRTDSDVETVTMVAGTSGGGFGGNNANMNVQLKPVGVRKSTSDQVIARITPQDLQACQEPRYVLQNALGRAPLGGRQGQRAIPVHPSRRPISIRWRYRRRKF